MRHTKPVMLPPTTHKIRSGRRALERILLKRNITPPTWVDTNYEIDGEQKMDVESS